MATDPVCGMEVDEKDAAAQATYAARTYFFCCDGCRAEFEQAPQKYVEAPSDSRG